MSSYYADIIIGKIQSHFVNWVECDMYFFLHGDGSINNFNPIEIIYGTIIMQCT